MFPQSDRSRAYYPRLVTFVRSSAVFLVVFITYGVLIAVGTAHMSNGERAEILMPWRIGGAAELDMHVRIGHLRCVFDNLFIGDGMVRIGGSCKSESGVER
jgi:hypothetical protein